MRKRKIEKTLTVLFSFSFVLSYARFDDFCNNLYEYYSIGSKTAQDKYLSKRLDDITNGNKVKRNKATKDILRIVSKKRTGICSVKFLESLSVYINDYIGILENNGGNAMGLSLKVKKYVGDRVNCLVIRNELNLSGNVHLPRAVCKVNRCNTTLLQLYKAFTTGVFIQDSKKVLLSSFLKMFWRNYYSEGKGAKTDVINLWRQDICGHINVNIIKPMMTNKDITDYRELIDDDEFKGNVSNYILTYFGKTLIPKCGTLCINKIIKLAEDVKLNCNVRSQLLGLVASSLMQKFSTSKKTDEGQAIKLFKMIEKLLQDKCYSVELVMDILFDLELYKHTGVMKIVLDGIFPALRSNSFDSQFVKYLLVAGFMNVSDKINEIALKDRLLGIVKNEFEQTSDYDYKDLLLRALFAFNEYKYILKNRVKLFKEYLSRSINSKVKGIPDAQADFFVNTMLEIGGLYSMDVFRDFVAKNARIAIQNFSNKGAREEDIKYLTILFSLYPYNDKGIVRKFLLKIVNGNFSTLLKQYALKGLLYLVSGHKLFPKYLNRFFKDKKIRCLAALIGSLIHNKIMYKNIDEIDNCKFIKMNTQAVKELVKISFDEKWENKLKNTMNALNIFSLNFSRADKFVTYATCNVGHEPSYTPVTFVKNVVYGLECEEKCDKKGCYCKFSCDKLVFPESLVYLLFNNITNPLLYRKLNRYTSDFVYIGTLKFIMRKIARELNATVSFKALRNKNYEYLLQLYSGYILPHKKGENHSLISYKTLLARISERFLITFLLTRTRRGVNVIKVLPFATASNIWQRRLQDYFK